MTVRLIDTPRGSARVTIERPREPHGTLVLGHGAGGQSWSRDVLALREVAYAAQLTTVLVDQPWRVAGKKVAGRPEALDEAWLAVVDTLVSDGLWGSGAGELWVGGRSAGARVACRTAADVGARQVICLSFPLHPPGAPEKSRAPEVLMPTGAGVPVLVVQGANDPMGVPAEFDPLLSQADGLLRVTAVAGSHTLRDPSEVAKACQGLL